jgi:RNA-directed DNA polymerase
MGSGESADKNRQEVGTLQGAVISPLLANVFLHYVLDIWVSWWRRTQTRGEMIIERSGGGVTKPAS